MITELDPKSGSQLISTHTRDLGTSKRVETTNCCFRIITHIVMTTQVRFTGGKKAARGLEGLYIYNAAIRSVPGI